ncbi:branched-chain amino acid ABC transporter permease [Egibacter rhizosphaerae]|uniref:Branched-chain amino acid ABC transporter permease n=1 Tax=Egibacter rhizosphaerae TaxID=1670831 RepID=A0A411YJQ4_9ACTN|nr:branched-chain amino acid ABC transporter permease [Egibacter rhizosphaerae]QBI21428.1 branched-chain amino acid ABC transporter permease [Egibacter rhizosphaerae]
MTQFVTVTLNALTLAALYFLVASGLTLIFGLMRVVNLAHGTLYLLGGYVAWLVVDAYGFIPGLIVAAVTMGVLGVVLQQGLLRWIEGNDMRVALVTIGLSLIGADQMLAYFGGTAHSIPSPEVLRTAWPIGVAGVSYPAYRLTILFIAVATGVLLWLLLQRTRFGLIIRAGVDDRDMVSATGINIRVVFLGIFFLGSALAGFSGAIGGATFSLAPGVDIEFLLFSLVVIIVGGMGSIPGAAIGAVLVGLVSQYALAWATPFSAILTFGLMILVLAVRPQGLLGRAA